MAGEVVVNLSEADYVAANRDLFRLARSAGQRLVDIAAVALLCAGLGAAIAWWDGRDAAAEAWLFGLIGLVVILLLYAIGYLSMPAQGRRLFRQQSTLHDPIHYHWSEAGFGYRTARASADIAWADYYRWAEGRRSFLFFLSERMFHIVPLRALSEAEADDLRATATASGLPWL